MKKQFKEARILKNVRKHAIQEFLKNFNFLNTMLKNAQKNIANGTRSVSHAKEIMLDILEETKELKAPFVMTANEFYFVEANPDVKQKIADVQEQYKMQLLQFIQCLTKKVHAI